MKSNYKKLGDLIKKINVRNTELKVTNLKGINIDKFFMPSVANTVGTDMSKYKIVKKGQFACNRMHVGRDKRLPIALLTEEEIIVSPAYDVFEIVDPDILNSDYLMMWFLRDEFDRNTWFYTDADVRGGLKWEDFCEITLPVPTLSDQLEIVKEFKVIQEKIKLNNNFIKNLEKTAEAIYYNWFIEFEFPNMNRKPYKSSGDEMEFNDKLNGFIPKEWNVLSVGEVIETIGGGTPSTEESDYWVKGDILWYSPTDLTKGNALFTVKTEKKITNQGLQNSSAKLFPAYSLMMTSRATIGKLGINTKPASTNQGFIVLLPTEKYNVYFLYNWVKTQLDEIKRLASGSTFLEISKKSFNNLNLICPSDQVMLLFNKLTTPIYKIIELKNNENVLLEKTKELLLIKLVKMGG